MKWFKWLRKPKSDENGDIHPGDSKIATMVSANQGARMARNEVATHPLTTLVEPQDALLRFARDYLLASGARVISSILTPAFLMACSLTISGCATSTSLSRYAPITIRCCSSDRISRSSSRWSVAASSH